MSEEEDQYEVESVTRARVAKRSGRGKRLYWQYRVKWKGYDKPEDDTWEPTESFEGSEHFLEQFWQRASRKLEGRDITNMNLFKAGEEFFPMGPPPRRPKRKTTELEEQSSPAAHPDISKSNKRPRTSPVPTSDQHKAPESHTAHSPKATERTPSTTRYRQSNPVPEPSSSSRRSPRKPPVIVSEIVPPSDDEYDGVEPVPNLSPVPQIDSFNDVVASEKSPRYRKQGNQGNLGHVPFSDVEDDTRIAAQAPVDSTKAVIPAHRQRALNPLVRREDEFKDMDGAIAVKARLSQQAAKHTPAGSSTGQTPHKRKPGPGRSSAGFLNKSTSSLLTVEKGELKFIKGKYVATSEVVRRDTESTDEAPDDAILDLSNWNSVCADANEAQLHVSAVESPIVPPTSQELLQMAGLDTRTAEDLQDFEEGARDSLDPRETNNGSGTLLQQSLALAKDSLFPASWSAASIGSAMSAAWKRSTIFGPLGSASDAHVGVSIAEPAQTSPFLLTLDVTVAVPVFLTDMSSNLDSIVRNTPKGPPGKFYSREAVLSVLDTLRTDGPSARVVIAPDASEPQKRDFEKLKGKLSKDELFVIIVGTEVLVFCSSDSALISQRLNFPALLTSLPGNVLVRRVSIENHSAYANAAVEVDSVCW